MHHHPETVRSRYTRLWFVALTLLFVSSRAYGVEAKVVYIDPTLRFLVIDKGTFKDLAAGSHICLLNEIGFIVTCSGIVLANKTKAGLRFPIEEMQKLSVGSKVRLKVVYLKAEGPKGPKDPPRFYQAKVSPKNLPKPILRDAVLAEKLLGMREIGRRSPEAETTNTDSKNPGENDETATAKLSRTESSQSKSTPDTPNGDPTPQELESGQEVTHQVGQPYPEHLTKPTMPEDNTKSAEKSDDQTDKQDQEERQNKKIEEHSKTSSGPSSPTFMEQITSLFTRDPPIKFFRYEMQMLLPIVPHIKYNHLDFDTISTNSNNRWSLWRPKTPQRPTNGLGFQFKIFGRGTWVYNFGWRYWNYDHYRSVQRLDKSFPYLVADTKMRVDTYGVWAELGRRSLFFWKLGYYYGGGLDFDTSEIKFQSIRHIDSGVERSNELVAQEGIIAFARSNLNVLSIRVSGSLEFSIFNVGTSLGGVLLFPIYAPEALYEGHTAVPGNVDLSRSGETDLKDSIGHSVEKFGAELSLGIFFNI